MYGRTDAELRTLILAPAGRDADLLAETLSGGGMMPAVCPAHRSLVEALNEGAAAAIVAEEALSQEAVGELAEWSKAQPPWSDFPFVVLTSGGRQKAREMERLGNVTFLERPVRPDTVRSALRTAARARHRQYELRHRQETLAQVNADLEQFAHLASHDLREPIRNIAIYTELLATRYGRGMDDQARQFLEYMRTGALRMELLVNDLLSYTEVSAIEDAMHSAIGPEQPMELALANLREIIGQSGAVVTLVKLLPVRMRDIHLQQLFQNLIANALKYRSEAVPEVEVRSKMDGGCCVYSVRDNGIGIAAEYHEQIFEMFKRLHTASKYPGTGMGLAICRRIVERYRGKIWVESEVGRGSKFIFKIPA